MAWLVCFICGVAGAVLAAFLGDWITGVYRMSNFEGGRGYFVLFALIPLGFLGGLVIGALTVWRIGPTGYLRMQGLALLLTAAACCVVAVVAFLLADHPPRIRGSRLVLEFELRLPQTFQPIEGRDQGGINVALGEPPADVVPAYPDLGSARRGADGALVVPGQVALLAHSSQRFLQGNFGLADGYYSFTFELALAASPSPADETWSRWIADQDTGGASAAEKRPQQRPMLRYRVQAMP